MEEQRFNAFISNLTPIECDVWYVDDQARFSVRGELDLSTLPVLLREFREVVAFPVGGIAVDLGGVTFMDSSGIHALLTIREEAARRRIPFTLATVSKSARMVLEVSGLSDHFGLEPS